MGEQKKANGRGGGSAGSVGGGGAGGGGGGGGGTKSTPRPTMEEVMDELQSRFLVNLPATELASSERLFFQIEQCYWFYEDFYADHMKHLQHLKLNEFAKLLFGHCPLLRPLAHQCDKLFQDFKVYQSQVPVVGCILLNAQRSKLLLVRNWKGTSWSFPRGKVNQDESDIECARREVFEECGYDVGSDALHEKVFIEFVQNEQRMRMFIASGVPEEFKFAPQTRKEISLIQWFEFDALPKKTWCVLPFMPRLRRWIQRDKGGSGRNNKAAQENKARAASAPRNRPLGVITNTVAVAKKTVLTASERSVSTPHARPVARKGRGHFGTEFETGTSYDGVNDETFGAKKAGFSVEDMFSVNEKLTGQKFEYDGNPHDFGKPVAGAGARGSSRGVFQYGPQSRGVVPTQILPRGMATASANGTSKLNGEASASSPGSGMDRAIAEQSHKSGLHVFRFDAGDIMACVN